RVGLDGLEADFRARWNACFHVRQSDVCHSGSHPFVRLVVHVEAIHDRQIDRWHAMDIGNLLGQTTLYIADCLPRLAALWFTAVVTTDLSQDDRHAGIIEIAPYRFHKFLELRTVSRVRHRGRWLLNRLCRVRENCVLLALPPKHAFHAATDAHHM